MMFTESILYVNMHAENLEEIKLAKFYSGYELLFTVEIYREYNYVI